MNGNFDLQINSEKANVRQTDCKNKLFSSDYVYNVMICKENNITDTLSNGGGCFTRVEWLRVT